MQPRGRLGISRAEPQHPLPGRRTDRAHHCINHAQMSMHSTQGMTRAEQVIGLHQGMPLTIQVTDQFVELHSRKRIQAHSHRAIDGHWRACGSSPRNTLAGPGRR